MRSTYGRYQRSSPSANGDDPRFVLQAKANGATKTADRCSRISKLAMRRAGGDQTPAAARGGGQGSVGVFAARAAVPEFAAMPLSSARVAPVGKPFRWRKLSRQEAENPLPRHKPRQGAQVQFNRYKRHQRRYPAPAVGN
jgi:hypothetical protein